MPRKAPNLNGGVIEHRITLGDYERREFKSALDVALDRQKTSMYIEAGKATVYAGVIATVGYLGFLGVGLIGEGLGAATDIVDEVRGKGDVIINGKSTYETKYVPPNPEDWVGRDPDTGERINPLNYGTTKGRFPVFGGLVGLGISWGENSFNFVSDVDNAIRETIGAQPNANA